MFLIIFASLYQLENKLCEKYPAGDKLRLEKKGSRKVFYELITILNIN
jgi:hypothetical protein